MAQPVKRSNCGWCKHSQVRHGALHCGIDGINLETVSNELEDVAQNCRYYEFDALKHSIRKFYRRMRIISQS